jgi:hypothetical protein
VIEIQPHDEDSIEIINLSCADPAGTVFAVGAYAICDVEGVREIISADLFTYNFTLIP